MKNVVVLVLIFCLSNTWAQVSDFETVDFTRADNTAKLYEGYALDNLALLAHELTHKLPTDVEKFRAIYYWVCHNIKVDGKQDREVIEKRIELKNDRAAYLKWNESYKKVALKKLFEDKKTMCSGYAYLIKKLSTLAGIESEIINGYGRTNATNVNELELVNHAWNAVKLNDKWYLCDANWASGYLDDQNIFVKDYNDGFFLTDPLLFAQSHYPLQKEWFLRADLEEAEVLASPLVYTETYKHNVLPVSPKKMHLTKPQNEEITFSFRSSEAIDLDKISLIYYLGVKEKPFKIYDLKHENGITTFKYTFKRKKFYDVHLKIEDDIVATYTIDVIGE